MAERYSLTQPACFPCFNERYPGGPEPVKLLEPEDEICCFCGAPTVSGIYDRVDPSTVPFPTNTKSDG